MTAPAKLALLVLQGLQVAFVLLHDWVPLGRWSNRTAVRASDSTLKLLWTTILSALPFAVPFGFCCWLRVWPMWLLTWLLYTYAVGLVMIVFVWWIPYFSSKDSERAERYRTRFAGTIGFLPKRHGFAPDALHVMYHCCVVATVVLLVLR